MAAPDEPSRLAASWVTSWRRPAGSWLLIIRRAISRSARSAFAVRSSVAWDVASRSARRAFETAIEASPDRAPISRSSSSPNAPALAVARLEDAEQPVLADHRGREHRAQLVVADGLVALVVVLEAGVLEVVVRGDRPPFADAPGPRSRPGRRPTRASTRACP